MSAKIGAPVGAISRQLDTTTVAKGWVDGRGKRQRTPIAKRENKSRTEKLYHLGYQAAVERKSLGGAFDEYKEWAEQERIDQINELYVKHEATDLAMLAVNESEEGDSVLEELVDLEETQEEGQDPVQEEVQEDEGEDLTLEEEAAIETYDVEHEVLLLEEEDDG
jgi:hypothetical protein